MKSLLFIGFIFIACLAVVTGCFSENKYEKISGVYTNNGVLFFELMVDSTYVEYELEIASVDYSANSLTKKRKNEIKGSFKIEGSQITFTQKKNTDGFSFMEMKSPLSISANQMCYFDPMKGRICFDRQ